jgi:hypothetical protein
MPLTIRENGYTGIEHVLHTLEPRLPAAFTLLDPTDGAFLRVERRGDYWYRTLSVDPEGTDRTRPLGDSDLGLLWANRPGRGDGWRWKPRQVVLVEAEWERRGRRTVIGSPDDY